MTITKNDSSQGCSPKRDTNPDEQEEDEGRDGGVQYVPVNCVSVFCRLLYLYSPAEKNLLIEVLWVRRVVMRRRRRFVLLLNLTK